MGKIEISPERVFYPMPCSLVGALVQGRPNFLTVAWFSMLNPKPPYLGIALNKNHYTNRGIKENQAFSINIPPSKLVQATDYCGLVSGKDQDKSTVFQVFYGKLNNAPMIKECGLNAELRLIQVVDMPQEELFIGEIIAVYVDEEVLTQNKPDLAKLDPFLLVTSPERKYIGLGRDIAKAWDVGKALIKK